MLPSVEAPLDEVPDISQREVAAWPAVPADKWHIVVTTVIALFSVPTIILLTIIRSSSSMKTEPDSGTKNLHTLIGEKLLNLLEKLADKVIAKN